MTVQDQVNANVAVVADNTRTTVERTKAAQTLLDLKRKSKKSFEALNVSKTNQQLVETLLNPAERAFDGKMPAGVHKLSNMPKGNNVKGKVWEDVQVILPDGSGPVDGRFESKRGGFVYFYVDGQGYRAVRHRFNLSGGVFALNDAVKK